jgi:hypothetical protein
VGRAAAIGVGVRSMMRVTFRHGFPGVVVGESVGTRIVTHRGLTSTQRHDTLTRISVSHPCTLIYEEPIR